jgi:fructose-bisphosphate aldolase class II
MQAMSDLCADRLERFGTAGNASRIKPLSLSAMASRYAAGGLDPVIG